MEGHKASFCLEDNDCQGKRPPIINHSVNAAINHDVSNTLISCLSTITNQTLNYVLKFELIVIAAIITLN